MRAQVGPGTLPLVLDELPERLRALPVVRWGEGLPLLVRDGALALLVAAFEIVSLAVKAGDGDRATPTVAFVVLAVTQIPLAWRRQRPMVAWFLVGLGTAAYGLSSWTDPPVYVGALLAVYSAAAYASRPAVVVAGVATGSAVVVGALVDPAPHDLNDVLLPVLGYATAFLAGGVMAAHRRNLALLDERALRAEADRHRELEQARVEERLRIARELHDVTAHQVAVIAIHAEAGAATAPDDAADARLAFATIADAARRALGDLRAAVGVLRDVAPAALSPQPRASDVGELVDELRAAGIDARLEAHDPLPGLDDQVDLTVYRLVQEAVTNILKHAHARHVDVRLSVDGAAVQVEITDDGRGLEGSRTGDAAPDGHGLLGMRERVESCGGTLKVDPGPGGVGVSVWARLPA